MPNLFKRGGVYWYSFTIDGKRVRRSSKTADKRLAEDIAAKDEWRHRHAAVHGAEAVLTFGEAMTLYVETERDTRFLLPILDRWDRARIADLTAGAIRQAALDLYPSASNATRNRQVITPAQAIINFAADMGLCQHIRVRRLPVENKRKRRAADRSWHRLFAANCEDPALRALARFMFETGARIGEAVSLTWDDVNLTDALASFGKTKNGEPHEVYLSQAMVAELANLPRTWKVFGFNSRHVVYPKWRDVCEKAGIVYLSPHEAGRHGFATEMIVRNGVDIPTAAELGNWKSHRLLSETYAHPERKRDVMKKVWGTK